MENFTARIIESADVGHPDLPGFPPDAVQARFVGRSGRSALEEVLPFVDLIKKYSKPSATSQVLDFGVGWGRIARFFQNAVPAENLHLADVDPAALKWCEDCKVKGARVLLDHIGSLPFKDGSLDVVYSYSVFSHLAEASAVHWLDEIHRALKPNGILIFTTQSMRFLQLVVACHEKSNPSPMEASIGTYMGPNPRNSMDRYAKGHHAYSDVNGGGGGGILSGEFYGWAAIPPIWFEERFTRKFTLEQYVDNPKIMEQSVFVVRKN